MTMQYRYQARFENDPDGGLLVTFPDIPEAITHGETLDDAMENAREALGLALRGYALAGDPLPKASTSKKLPWVGPDAEDVLKLAAIEAFRESGMTKVALAGLMGKRETEIRRILDPDHPSKLAAMQETLRLLGKEIVIEIRDAA